MLEILNAVAQSLGAAAGFIAWFGISALAVSMFVCCLMLLRLAEVADRAIIFDLVMVHVVGLIALAAIVLGYPLLLDTLIVVAVLGFLGTVAIARYLERGLPAPKIVTLPPSERGGKSMETL